VVVNDASTPPASLGVEIASGDHVEIRLVSATDPGIGTVRFTAALLGSGDHRARTEDRPPPPRVAVGEVLGIGGELIACGHLAERGSTRARTAD
jgi:S-adenosylmethionine:tRNA ribosyltransferase-isomerase